MHTNTQLLIKDYLAGGGTITRLPDGVADGALRLDTKCPMPNRNSPKTRTGWELSYGTGEMQND